MRMMSRVKRPTGLAQSPRRFTWGGHMAPHGVINAKFINPKRWILTPPRRHLFRPARRTRLQMEHHCSHSSDCFGSAHRPLSPLRSQCPGGCATGRRRSLHCCLDTLPGHHFSTSNFCSVMFNSHTSPVIVGHINSTPAAPSGNWSDSSRNFSMPRLRQRMSCRKGASRGRSMSERPSNSNVDYSMEQAERCPIPLYVDLAGRLHESVAPAPPQPSHPPRAPALNTLSPPPLQASASPSRPGSHYLRQSTQHAELRFDCAFDRPSITALITISLREETTLPPAQPPNPVHSPSKPNFEPPSGPAPGPSAHPLGIPLASVPAHPGQAHLQMEAGPSGEDADKNDEEDAEEHYGCRIEEENPDSD